MINKNVFLIGSDVDGIYCVCVLVYVHVYIVCVWVWCIVGVVHSVWVCVCSVVSGYVVGGCGA